MKLVLMDPLGHAENIDTNLAIVSQTSCPPFRFFELLLDHLSDFHQIRVRSSSDCEKVMDFMSLGETVFVYRIDKVDGMIYQNYYISAKLWHIDTKHCHLTLSTAHQFCHSVTQLLVESDKPLNQIISDCLYEYLAILPKIILKCL